MSIAEMRNIIKRISQQAGINKEIHPHQLRHSYATNLLNNGALLEVIQSLLGHEKSETTRIYAQLNGRLREDLYRKYFYPCKPKICWTVYKNLYIFGL
jgi:integrase/recombinase XerD